MFQMPIFRNVSPLGEACSSKPKYCLTGSSHVPFGQAAPRRRGYMVVVIQRTWKFSLSRHARPMSSSFSVKTRSMLSSCSRSGRPNLKEKSCFSYWQSRSSSSDFVNPGGLENYPLEWFQLRLYPRTIGYNAFENCGGGHIHPKAEAAAVIAASSESQRPRP